MSDATALAKGIAGFQDTAGSLFDAIKTNLGPALRGEEPWADHHTGRLNAAIEGLGKLAAGLRKMGQIARPPMEKVKVGDQAFRDALNGTITVLDGLSKLYLKTAGDIEETRAMLLKRAAEPRPMPGQSGGGCPLHLIGRAIPGPDDVFQ